MEITLKELIEQLEEWRTQRPEFAKYPRVNGNPYGDNVLGVAYDDGWWEALKWAREQGFFKDS